MQLKSVQIFLDVVDTGSFVSAAERRHTVQSNVTAHIKKLEDELGIQLFHRKGGARLTTAGKTVVDYARQMLTAHDNVLDLFKGAKDAPGKLHLGAMETTTAVRLPSVLSGFHESFPEVDLLVETGPTSTLISRLMDGAVDGIFVAGKPGHSQFHSFKVFSEKLVLIGPSSLKQMPSSEEFLESAFLAFRQGCSYRQRIELLLSSCGVASTRVFEFGSIDGIFGCVSAGMGYALMPESVVKSHQKRFNISHIKVPPEISEVDTYFVTADPNTWTPALARFSEMLRSGR